MSETTDAEQQTQTSIPPTPAEQTVAEGQAVAEEQAIAEKGEDKADASISDNPTSEETQDHPQKLNEENSAASEKVVETLPEAAEQSKQDATEELNQETENTEQNVIESDAVVEDQPSAGEGDVVKAEATEDESKAISNNADDEKSDEHADLPAGDSQSRKGSAASQKSKKDDAVTNKEEEGHPPSSPAKTSASTNEKLDNQQPVISSPALPAEANINETNESTSQEEKPSAEGTAEKSATDQEGLQSAVQPESESQEATLIQVPMPSAGIDETNEAQSTGRLSTKEADRVSTAEASKPSSPKENTIPRAPSLHEESKVESASADDTMTQQEDLSQPLNLEWTFGFNRRVPCINLSDGSRSVVLYISSHIAVLYDYKNNQQKLLQGHGNTITCMACSEDKRWLVTGDKGAGSSVIVWDSYTGIPVQIIFDLPGNDGVAAVGMSRDAKYIVTVSSSSPQIVCVWDWTSSSDSPIHQTELKSTYQHQTYVSFHSLNNELFVTNSEAEVIFYSWTSGKLLCDSPLLTDTTFNRAVGAFSQTIFQTELPNRALTATSLGNLVVWDPDRPSKKNNGIVPIHKKRALKLVRVKDKGLTALSQVESLVVTGDTAGHVTFFDHQLNLIVSYVSLSIGPVSGITFKYIPEIDITCAMDHKDYCDTANINENTFVVRDFVVSTRSAEIINVGRANAETKINRIFKEHDAAVHAIATSPTKPWLCIGSYAGLLKLWNYKTKKVLITRVFENKTKIQSIAFSHDGLSLAVGMANGAVHILDTLSFSDEVSFHYARDAITHCVFSHDSKYLATADGQCTTTVFEYQNNAEWAYLGRYKAHYKPIQDLVFGIDPDSSFPRLLSLGKDRVLVEYDLQDSSKDDLRLHSTDRIEQSAVPLCLTWYPPVVKESFLLTSNDQYKMKLYNTTTKMCRKTLLGPTYGTPARLIAIVPAASEDLTADRMLCYATENKVGVQLLPLDGNPHRSAASIAHPRGVSRLVCSNDGRVFSAGGREATVHMWSINKTALEAVAALGGEDLLPFYGLLDGGREGEMFAELENYFYYAQLRSQGISTTDEREVSKFVPLDQVPFIMRALGFYPSEQEVEDMLNEVKFSEYVETGQYVTKLDLADLIKLYINHRPAFGLSPNELKHAFEVIGENYEGQEPLVDRSELLSLLQRKGEHMTEYELAECLTTLLGFCPEGGSVELGTTLEHEEASRSLEEALPDAITPSMFANEILGLNLYG